MDDERSHVQAPLLPHVPWPEHSDGHALWHDAPKYPAAHCRQPLLAALQYPAAEELAHAVQLAPPQ